MLMSHQSIMLNIPRGQTFPGPTSCPLVGPDSLDDSNRYCGSTFGTSRTSRKQPHTPHPKRLMSAATEPLPFLSAYLHHHSPGVVGHNQTNSPLLGSQYQHYVFNLADWLPFTALDWTDSGHQSHSHTEPGTPDQHKATDPFKAWIDILKQEDVMGNQSKVPLSAQPTAASPQLVSSTLNPNAKVFTPPLNPLAKEFRPATTSSFQQQPTQPESTYDEGLTNKTYTEASLVQRDANLSESEGAIIKEAKSDSVLSSLKTETLGHDDKTLAKQISSQSSYDSNIRLDYDSNTEDDSGEDDDDDDDDEDDEDDEEDDDDDDDDDEEEDEEEEELLKKSPRHRSLSSSTDESLVEFVTEKPHPDTDESCLMQNLSVMAIAGKDVDGALSDSSDDDSGDEDSDWDEVDHCVTNDTDFMAQISELGLSCPLLLNSDLSGGRGQASPSVKCSSTDSNCNGECDPTSDLLVSTEDEEEPASSHSSIPKRIQLANEAWTRFYGQNCEDDDNQAEKRQRSVRIAPNEVSLVLFDNPDYVEDLKAYRRCEIAQRSADKLRMNRLIGGIMEPEHRQKMWNYIQSRL